LFDVDFDLPIRIQDQESNKKEFLVYNTKNPLKPERDDVCNMSECCEENVTGFYMTD
jgi:hypothetical protein